MMKYVQKHIQKTLLRFKISLLKVDDSLPVDYVGKHSDEELMVLNDAVIHQNKKVPPHL